MRLNAAEQESFQKHLKIFFVKNPNLKDSEIVNNFDCSNQYINLY